MNKNIIKPLLLLLAFLSFVWWRHCSSQIEEQPQNQSFFEGEFKKEWKVSETGNPLIRQLDVTLEDNSKFCKIVMITQCNPQHLLEYILELKYNKFGLAKGTEQWDYEFFAEEHFENITINNVPTIKYSNTTKNGYLEILAYNTDKYTVCDVYEGSSQNSIPIDINVKARDFQVNRDSVMLDAMDDFKKKLPIYIYKEDSIAIVDVEHKNKDVILIANKYFEPGNSDGLLSLSHFADYSLFVAFTNDKETNVKLRYEGSSKELSFNIEDIFGCKVWMNRMKPTKIAPDAEYLESGKPKGEYEIMSYPKVEK